jgi:hypothetical protein
VDPITKPFALSESPNLVHEVRANSVFYAKDEAVATKRNPELWIRLEKA